MLTLDNQRQKLICHLRLCRVATSDYLINCFCHANLMIRFSFTFEMYVGINFRKHKTLR